MKVKSLSCARLLGIPWTVAYQAPPSMGFSRQEYWSAVPLPFPLYTVKVKVKVKSLSGARLFAAPWTSPGQNTGVGSLFPSPGDLLNPGIKPRSPALQVDSLPAEPQRKSKNTWVGSLSLLQRIFPTQESNQGLLHCRWILYQLSYQGSP